MSCEIRLKSNVLLPVPLAPMIRWVMCREMHIKAHLLLFVKGALPKRRYYSLVNATMPSLLVPMGLHGNLPDMANFTVSNLFHLPTIVVSNSRRVRFSWRCFQTIYAPTANVSTSPR